MNGTDNDLDQSTYCVGLEEMSRSIEIVEDIIIIKDINATSRIMLPDRL